MEPSVQNIAEEPPESAPGESADSEAEALESRTLEIGGEIIERMAGGSARLPAALIERVDSIMMDALMRDEPLKFALLRFVDTYPVLAGDATLIASHLREYLENARRAVKHDPSFVRPTLHRFLIWAASRRILPALPLAWAVRMGIHNIGGRFIAGRNAAEVAPRLARLESEGCSFSLDLLGEHVASRNQADLFADRYRQLVESLGEMLAAGPSDP